MQSAESPHHEDEFLKQGMENGLRDCIDGLPELQKMSIELFYFESKSYQEIAQIMSTDKEQIRSFIQNGRRNLKTCMEQKTGDHHQ
jgi:RNA polymerase sigma-70 factor (ECF subfamily)